MKRHAGALALLLALVPQGCVAAIGNTGYGLGNYPKTATPLLQERIEAARRIVELRQRRLDELRKLREGGSVDAATIVEAEVAVEEARLQLLECRAQLAAVEAQKDKD